MIPNLWMFFTCNDKRFPVGMWADIKYAKSEQKFELWLCDLAQPLALLSDNKTGMLWNDKIYRAEPWPDILWLHDLLSPSSSLVTSPEGSGSVELLDVVACSSHAPYIFVPAVSFAWYSSPYFVIESFEQAPPLEGSRAFLTSHSQDPFTHQLPVWAPKARWISHYQRALIIWVQWFLFCWPHPLASGGFEDRDQVLVIYISLVLVEGLNMLGNCLLNEWIDS